MKKVENLLDNVMNDSRIFRFVLQAVWILGFWLKPQTCFSVQKGLIKALIMYVLQPHFKIKQSYGFSLVFSNIQGWLKNCCIIHSISAQ